MTFRLTILAFACLYLLAAAQRPERQDDEYNQLIAKYLQDPRISTELVDHMPASETVPSPLKFFGRIPGTPGELTYAKDIHRYYEALAQASPRARFWKIGQTEEGRDMVILAISDEATMKLLDKYKDMLGQLADPRKIDEEQARKLIHTAKPIYWVMSGVHSPETGGPEMLIELAFRLIVEETPFIQAIRKNVITFITPVIEVDGREKAVDTYYYGKKTGKPRPPLMYWGKYVQHDNNRDGMGQYLDLTKNITNVMLEWHPTVSHDLHEAQSYLYISTGTGPYNNSLDPLQIDEWWLLAQTEVMEMTRRGVPGVWTYGFYDGWTPNYLLWIATTHNLFGRFYEVQSYGPDVTEKLQLATSQISREWYRPNPPLADIKWGPRNNVNIQESALLFALRKVALDRELYLDNFWAKNRRAVNKGRRGPIFAWLIPANQRRKVDAADMVNHLRRQGLEIQRADAAFTAGNVEIAQGDYIIRADQPYRTLADMYFSVQDYPPSNPRPYDDTGWTMQYMRNVKVTPVRDKEVLDHAMTLLTADTKPAGEIDGWGATFLMENTTDNALMAFRFRNKEAKMMVAEEDFEENNRKWRAGTFIIPGADRPKIEPSLKDLGLSATAVAVQPLVKTHELKTPRIGFIHSWSSTQNEGWVRAALDYYGIPYTYFADQKLREWNLASKFDVIIFPQTSGTPREIISGIPKTGKDPIPYKKSDLTPNLGVLDESDDVRGGMGMEGVLELERFVEEGGTLITEGSTAALMAEFNLNSGIAVEHPAQLFARGSILRGTFTDMKSPIAYGYAEKDLPIYFNQDPVLSTSAPAAASSFQGSQTVTVNAEALRLSTFDNNQAPNPAPVLGGPGPVATQAPKIEPARSIFAGPPMTPLEHPRIIMRFPSKAQDMLLSGTLSGGEALANRALVADVSLGKGHIVMFALRPFWRWQTQGTFFLAFNTILNWDHLDAGK
jgi:hypothetical protein